MYDEKQARFIQNKQENPCRSFCNDDGNDGPGSTLQPGNN